jgi:SCF-associated factor 1
LWESYQFRYVLGELLLNYIIGNGVHEVCKVPFLGPIADMQIGGWSTVFLTSRGELFVAGMLDGQEMLGQSSSTEQIARLKFPRDTQTPESTSIQQFSCGRKAVLGLSDDTTIWYWHGKNSQAIKIEFPELQASDPERKVTSLAVTHVVAGWQHLSCYIRGHGIIVFPPIRVGRARRGPHNAPLLAPPIPVPTSANLAFAIVDGSTSTTTQKERRKATTNLNDNDIDLPGEVTSHIVLENFIVFTTDQRKVFASECPDFPSERSGQIQSPQSFEIPELRGALEVQGSFRSFGVFKESKEVLVTNQDFLRACQRRAQTGQGNVPPISVIPALQNSGVIQLAFGDYHYHALHADGSISSYGYQPQGSGALGLNYIRAFDTSIGNPNLDQVLLPYAYIRGRRVWFHPAQYEFLEAQLQHVQSAVASLNTDDPAERDIMRGNYTEWLEQMGSDWHKWPEVRKVDEDGLGPYFGMSIAAGGWSSGALMLVNDEVVEKIREVYHKNREEFERPVDLHNLRWKHPPPEFNFRRTDDNLSLVFGYPGYEEILREDRTEG